MCLYNNLHTYNKNGEESIKLTYRRAGNFNGGKVWQINSFQAFGKREFGELIDQPIGY